jgi:uncharacterized membrane protein YhaH (DUF805 family)
MDILAYFVFFTGTTVFIWFLIAEIKDETITTNEILFTGAIQALCLTAVLWSVLTLVHQALCTAL